MKTNWLAFNIRMPEELIPLYDFLQSELNFFLNDKKYRQTLLNIDMTKHRGNIWREMRDIVVPRIQGWTIHNKTWHSYILFENLRRELQSKSESITIWNELIANNKKINKDLFDNLVTKHKIYATRSRITNLLRANKVPELPTEAVFQLDYTISEKQIFKMSNDNVCQIKVSKTEWITYPIILPSSLNQNLTGKIAKPRFMKRKSDGRYIGICSYEYTPNKSIGNNTFGVDLGKIKLFSGSSLDKDGNYSNEYVHSKRTEHKKQKLKRLYEEKQVLGNKIDRVEKYKITTGVQARRKKNHEDITTKIINLKVDLAKNVANEIVWAAKRECCNVISLENLSWLGSKGKSWNHSEMQAQIIGKATTEGIRVVKVNASHTSSENPITGEIGNKSGRTVEFNDGLKIDRDVLASINIAMRAKKQQKSPKKLTTKRTARVKVSPSRKQEIKDKISKIHNGNSQIVVFPPQQLNGNTLGLWPVVLQDQSKSSLFMVNNH